MRWVAMGFMIAAISLGTACSQQQQSRPQKGWIADDKGCQVWDPGAAPTESFTWTGGCKDGHASGSGVLQWYDNKKPTDRYEGEFSDGRANGHGVLEWSGGRYDGEWRNFRPHGQGTYRDAKGEVFSGNWMLGCFKDGNRRASIGVPSSSCP